ncbi:MAG: putative N-acetylmannosamine-6-phosphate 2-epimerase [Acidobacteria bacterium]|nr:putative N-acetylmannosamine-6-phosphate 2-epimerase [Acidobacteriota bacterium]
MDTILQSLRHKLIVSCQAFPNDPMEDTETLRRVARSAVLGGASGLRLNSAEHVRAIRQDTDLPIIAIEKSFEGGQLRITPDFASAAALAAAGANIIALDCTDREHKHGEPWREIVRRIHDELGLLVMADIATLHDGILAAEGNADIVAPTLHGYTEETKHSLGFHPELVTALARETGKPIIAEGNVSTPALACIALEAGAWSVVVGSAITRPGVITATFVKEMASFAQPKPSQYVVGIDIGGTAVKAAVVSADGAIQFAHDVPTQASQGRQAIVQALDTALGTIRAASDAGLDLAGIGVASAGAIDAKNGTVFAATDNLPGWVDFDIKQHLRGISSLPAYVENDAQAAALAEVRFGKASGLSNIVAVTIGTGIGGGVIVDGRLVRGTFGFAGTIGHQTIRFDGRECNCGRRGCLEAYVSTVALVEEYRKQKPGAFADQPAATAAREVSRLSIEGDIAARQAYSQLASYLAEGLANISNILDPDGIILSGGLIEGQAAFVREVQERAQSLIHFGNKRPPVILHSESGRYAGVLGAAVSAFHQIGKHASA